MNKYIELSDFEINKKVARNMLPAEYHFNEKNEQVELIKFIGDTNKYEVYSSFDPCNNPTDAMPIIIENKISLLAGDSNFWCARYGEWNILPCPSGIGFIEKAQVINDSPYRAAMELFLLMKDAERETNT
ncbi:TPA: DUF2591 domain-containing protein [Proteus mirabilis]|nr:DUF2591 domain-containing protein [Proteus mirabilis]